jgi:hypothetical protein
MPIAAEELAAYENRLAGIENRLGSLGGWDHAAATTAILGMLLRGHGPLP